MPQDKVFKLLKQVSTIDFNKETTYSLDELKVLLSLYCKRELEETEALVVNYYYGLPGTTLIVSKEEEKAILLKVSNKFKHPMRVDGFSYFIGLKKKELIHPVNPTIQLEQSVNDLSMPEMVAKKLVDAGILTVNQLVNLSTMELYKILKGHRSFLRWVYKVIGNDVIFGPVTNENNSGLPTSGFVHCDTFYGAKNYRINKDGKCIPLGTDTEYLCKLFEFKPMNLNKYLEDNNVKYDDLVKVLSFLNENKKIRISDIQIILPTGFRTASHYVNFLIQHNVLSKEKDKDGYYPLNNE